MKENNEVDASLLSEVKNLVRHSTKYKPPKPKHRPDGPPVKHYDIHYLNLVLLVVGVLILGLLIAIYISKRTTYTTTIQPPTKELFVTKPTTSIADIAIDQKPKTGIVFVGDPKMTKNDYGRTCVIGLIENTSNKNAYFVKVTVFFYDKHNSYIGSNYSYVGNTDIPSMGKDSFSVNIPKNIAHEFPMRWQPQIAWQW